MSVSDRPLFQAIKRLMFRRKDVPVLLTYGLAFACLHWAAQPWGGAGFFSLWYPAAGLRFALLWRYGVRLTPWVMLTELAVDGVTGAVHVTGPDALHDILGAMRSALTCGLVMGALQRMAAGRRAPSPLPPIVFGLSAVGASILNALMVEPFQLLLPRSHPVYDRGVDLVIAQTSLMVGDLLGILVLAPLLLWLEEMARSRTVPAMPRIRPWPLVEGGGVLACSCALTLVLWRAGTGLQSAPGLLAGAWIGLRYGRMGAWLAILVQIAAILPYSAEALSYTHRLELHLGIASTVVVTWLAGSYCDAQLTAQMVLNRRNRMLFQAERLKTLRAMSVAVIHEISQPLSTLAIEASHLNDGCRDLDADLAESAALVDRKARELSDMVRRLRRFGGRDVDEPSPLQVALLLQTARQITAPELRATGIRLATAPVAADLFVQAQEIELTQALVNLLRNAMAAHGRVDGPVADMTLQAHVRGAHVHIEVTNATGAATQGGGMGVGLAIARTIIEAHGGTLRRQDQPGQVRFTLSLPMVGGIA